MNHQLLRLGSVFNKLIMALWWYLISFHIISPWFIPGTNLFLMWPEAFMVIGLKFYWCIRKDMDGQTGQSMTITDSTSPNVKQASKCAIDKDVAALSLPSKAIGIFSFFVRSGWKEFHKKYRENFFLPFSPRGLHIICILLRAHICTYLRRKE